MTGLDFKATSTDLDAARDTLDQLCVEASNLSSAIYDRTAALSDLRLDDEAGESVVKATCTKVLWITSALNDVISELDRADF